ncbi:unnamed protein product [Lymnaea stagnalis]|uniref:IRS-type PTB domain-containing protein n=1 Tax=Lymnaea stagnalis TaxID=6523 RepID=A0AAV2GYI1_LYMST
MEALAGKLTVKVPFFFTSRTYTDVWCVLYTGTRTHNPRIEVFENERAAKETNAKCMKVIYIYAAKWKPSVLRDHSFSFVSKLSRPQVFWASSREDLQKWISHLCIVCRELYDTKHIVGMNNVGHVDVNAVARNGEDMTLNTIYQTSQDDHNASDRVFMVIAEDSEDCKRIGLKGLYKLVLKAENIDIYNADTDEIVVSWSLFEIKKYGYARNYYYLIAGAKARTSDGRFSFYTGLGDKITDLLLIEANRLRVEYKDQIEAMKSAHPDGIRIDIDAPSTSTAADDPYANFETQPAKPPPTKPKPKIPKTPNKKPEEPDCEYSTVQKGASSSEKVKPKKDGDKKGKGKQKSQTDKKPVTENGTSEQYQDINEIRKKKEEGKAQKNNEDTVYSQAAKGEKPGIRGRDVKHTENYEQAPPIIPPVWERDGQDESNNNVYDHFQRGKSKQESHENVYGIASASTPPAPSNKIGADNPYEDTTAASPYESVGYN